MNLVLGESNVLKIFSSEKDMSFWNGTGNLVIVIWI